MRRPFFLLVVVLSIGLQRLPEVHGFAMVDLERADGRRWSLTNSVCRRDIVGQSLRVPPSTVALFSSSIKNKTPHYDGSLQTSLVETVTFSPSRSLAFSLLMMTCGAVLGPFLDSYHSAFGVLSYDSPITATLWGRGNDHPALITSWWVPPLFGLAGFIIGWLYILLDRLTVPSSSGATFAATNPSPPKILVGISFFTFQYWLSGILFQSGVGREIIFIIMSILAAAGFGLLDATSAGLITSLATAVGGPLIEVGLLTLSRMGIMGATGYHYNDLGETGFFPLWIAPVYFLGGPAVGNLARGFWSMLSRKQQTNDGDDIIGDNPNRLLPIAGLNNDYFALRHGQSLANVAGKIASNPSIACTEYGLSSTGQDQAAKAGLDVINYYKQHVLDYPGGIAILTSDLLRAKETAEAVRDAIISHHKDNNTPLPDLYSGDVVIERRLRERWFGDWDLTSDDNYNKVWVDDEKDPSHVNGNVESVNAVTDRVTQCILEWDTKLQLTGKEAGDNKRMVICVAHGDVLQILQTAFEKLDGSKHRSLPHLETATLRPLTLRG